MHHEESSLESECFRILHNPRDTVSYRFAGLISSHDRLFNPSPWRHHIPESIRQTITDPNEKVMEESGESHVGGVVEGIMRVRVLGVLGQVPRSLAGWAGLGFRQ